VADSGSLSPDIVHRHHEGVCNNLRTRLIGDSGRHCRNHIGPVPYDQRHVQTQATLLSLTNCQVCMSWNSPAMPAQLTLHPTITTEYKQKSGSHTGHVCYCQTILLDLDAG